MELEMEPPLVAFRRWRGLEFGVREEEGAGLWEEPSLLVVVELPLSLRGCDWAVVASEEEEESREPRGGVSGSLRGRRERE